jgi:hypothetical protein
VRLVALWALLFAVYAASIGVEARAGAAHGSDEAAYLAIADSLWDEGRLLREPQGAGFPLLIAPARALSAEAWLEAGLAALAFVLAALLARRIVPEPYASAGAAVAGLSPPAVAHATAVYPELAAGALLTGAAVCAVAAREHPRASTVVGGALMLALLPWLAIKYVVPAAPVAVALWIWCQRARRRLLGIVALELVVGSLVFYFTLNERLYGGPTPYSAGEPGRALFGAGSAGDYVDRIPRLAGLFLDRDFGLLRWAPVLALAFVAAWLLWRSRRDRLSRLIPARATAEAAAGLALAVCAGQLVVAAFGAPTMYGDWFPARQLAPALPLMGALCAWGLQRFPRVGAGLAAVTVATTAWLLVVRDPWVPPPSLFWDVLFPDYRTANAWAIVLTGALVAGLAALILVERGTRARGSATGRSSRSGPGRPH